MLTTINKKKVISHQNNIYNFTEEQNNYLKNQDLATNIYIKESKIELTIKDNKG